MWTYVGLFLAAAQVFHSAGCVINDMWDKDVDAAVRKCYIQSTLWWLPITLLLPARTSTRPLASGDVSMFGAFVFLIPQLALGVWLLMQLNEYRYVVFVNKKTVGVHIYHFYFFSSLRLGLSSLGLVVLYPAMKRVTNWPQAVLGMLYGVARPPR